MSSKPVSVACVLKQLTVSDRLLILLKLCMSVCARVCLVIEVKVNLIWCCSRMKACPFTYLIYGQVGENSACSIG